jgi:signal transduction histidine kinase
LYEPAAQDQGLALSCTAVPVSVPGNRQLLTQMLVNLIENALKHVGRGGALSVAVSRSATGARLEVADNGPGIPAEHRERVLRPFVRLSSTSATGHGLGLSLVAAIARLHRARLLLEDNAPGLRVIVEFGALSGAA